jgi:hypothetical protein
VDAIYITVLLLLRAVAEPASNQRGGGGANEPKALEQGENCTNSVIIKLYIYIYIDNGCIIYTSYIARTPLFSLSDP